MNWEYLVIAFIALGALVGYFQGFLKQVSALLGLIIGYLAAKLFSGELHNYLVNQKLLSADSSLWISFVLTIILVVVSIKFLAGFIEKILKSTGLNFTNRFAGMILGAFTYSCIILAVLYFLVSMNVLNKENTSDTLLDFIALGKSVVKLK